MYEGAMTGSTGANSWATLGSLTMSFISAAIWERPSGVRASPRNRSVTILTSLESPKNSSISCVAVAMACPGGRNATSAPSVGGARNVAPVAIRTVMTRRTMSVTYGRAVTSQLNQLSVLLMAYPPGGVPGVPRSVQEVILQ